MATYKVLQDIEAEDKFVGPLTLKQFIFAAIMTVAGYLSFLGLTKGLWIIAVLLFPIIAVTGFLAFPWRRDQPTEIWLLAKIQFLFKPRRRIWDQTGLQELVTITAPKKIEKILTNNLSQTEVKSRLQALANTIDSRGWAIKNVNVNLYSQPGYVTALTNESDRLIDSTNLPHEVTTNDIQAADDILDTHNPIAQQLDQMISQSSQQYRQQLTQSVQQAAQGKPVPVGRDQTAQQPANYWFLHENQQAVKQGYATFGDSVVTPGVTATPTPTPSAEEAQLLEKIHAKDKHGIQPSFAHLRTINPLGQQPAPPTPGKANYGQPDPRLTARLSQANPTPPSPPDPATAAAPPPPMTAPPDPAILVLANNDDLNVETIARQARRAHEEHLDDGEVVIRLH